MVSSWFYTSDEPFKLYPGVPPASCLSTWHATLCPPHPTAQKPIADNYCDWASSACSHGVPEFRLGSSHFCFCCQNLQILHEHSTLLSADSGPLSERPLPPLWPLPPSSSSQSCSSWLRTWALDLFCPLTRIASFPWYEYMNVLIPFQKDLNLTLLSNSTLLSAPPPILFSSRGQLSCLPHNLIFCCCCLFPVLPVLVGFFFFFLIVPQNL